MATPSEQVQELIKQKEKIEADIKTLMAVLESQGGVGMHGALVDEEQYPRNDIDVYSVRHARNKVICLQNDHKAVMKQIEEKLHEVHAEAKQKSVNQLEDGVKTLAATSTCKPFAKVNLVDAGSPSHTAGLKVGDEIVQFGSVDCNNFESLSTIATVVQHSKAKPMVVKILREGKEMRLSLTPNTWSGKGLLGCNIVAIPK